MGWSSAIEVRLIQFYENDHEAIDGSRKSAATNQRRQSAWQKVAVSLSVESGKDIEVATAKKTFQNIKAQLCCKLANNLTS